jgi:anti-anti-sigma factor
MNTECDIQCHKVDVSTEVVRVRGQLDAASARVLIDHGERVRAAGQDLVLNLAYVSLIASSGIGALLALVEAFRQGRQAIRIVAISPAVDSVVRLLNLQDILPFDPDEEAALAMLRGRSASVATPEPPKAAA